MKLSDFPKASDETIDKLKQEIDRAHPMAFTFRDCYLGPECVPDHAGIKFYKKDSRYYIALDRRVIYKGGDPPMMHLTLLDAPFFRTFPMLRDFLRELPTDEPPKPPPPVRNRDSSAKPRAAPAKDYDIDTVVNTDEVTIPKSEKRPLLDADSLRRELSKTIMGQDEAVAEISHVVPLHVNKEKPHKPLSAFFHGESGTGKSEMAKALAGAISKLGPHKYVVSWTDANTCSEPHSVSRFIGSPPGYVAHDSKNAFDLTTETPYVAYIFDEIEKAHPEILKMLLGILDEGRTASQKELPNRKWEYSFHHCLFLFTSNLPLGHSSKRQIGFVASPDIDDVQYADGSVDIRYKEPAQNDEATSIIQQIYKNNEAARKRFIAEGNLIEVASRINYFIEFKPLDDKAKVKVLAKQILDTSAEYGLFLTHISSSILQGLVNAAMSEKALVRAFKAVIEGYLAPVFAEAGRRYSGQAVRLTGTIEAPVLKPAQKH